MMGEVAVADIMAVADLIKVAEVAAQALLARAM